MKKPLSIFALSIFSICMTNAQQPVAAVTPPAMRLTTTAFPDGGIIPIKFSQAAPNALPGGGTSPELTWTNIPAGTQSFVVHIHDVDVTRNKTTDDNLHWIMWNIPGTTTLIPEGIPTGAPLADGSFQISASGAMYRGPGAAASGPLHHYVFEVYALDTKLDVKPVTDAFETRRIVLQAIEGHILGKAAYTGLFKRPQ